MEKKLELRMYFLTMYNLLDIQKGIQSGHAGFEYIKNHFKKYGTLLPFLMDFLEYYKTWIILSGGTSNSGKESYYGLEQEFGSMEQHLQLLNENNIECSPFYEPDLNYSLSSIAFIIDERVFNKKDYPDFKNFIINNLTLISPQIELEIKISSDEQLQLKYQEEYIKWNDLIGGKQIIFLREFLSDKRLA
jgi:hypothetical protein